MNLSLPRTFTAPGLPALEVSWGEALTCGELVCRAADLLVGTLTVVPDQLVTSARAETMLCEELFLAQPVILICRAHHVIASHVVPRHHRSAFLLCSTEHLRTERFRQQGASDQRATLTAEARHRR